MKSPDTIGEQLGSILLKSFSPNNRPVNLFSWKTRDPYYNQVLYVPCHLYLTSLSPRFWTPTNKIVLNKKLYLTWTTSYLLSNTFRIFICSGSNYKRAFKYKRYFQLSGLYFHYAPDAAKDKIIKHFTVKMISETTTNKFSKDNKWS
jgi:hypothetical protein